MAKSRIPLQVSPKFKLKLDELYGKIMQNGKKKSYRDLTDDIVNSPLFKEIENQILENGNVKMDIKLRLDRRIF